MKRCRESAFEALVNRPGIKPRLQNALARGNVDGRRLALPIAAGLRVGWDPDLLSGGAALLPCSCPEQPLWAWDSI